MSRVPRQFSVHSAAGRLSSIQLCVYSLLTAMNSRLKRPRLFLSSKSYVLGLQRSVHGMSTFMFTWIGKMR